ncbi:aminoacetone oxidase family FAD-binding enzyme, partial [Dehalococcoides sp.]
MPQKTTLVIGGGAAGMVASISKARRGEPVMILEKTAQLGKKILASGNGRCNLLNEELDSSSYNPEARPLVNSVFSRFGRDDILNFFSELGLHYYSQDGRIFPFTNQAASVQKVLALEIKRLGVQVEYGFDCVSIQKTQTGFSLGAADGKQQTGHSLILTGGGSTYPSFGSDGSGYKLASSLGHLIIKPVPSTVPLVVKDPLCHLLQGQRIIARAQS